MKLLLQILFILFLAPAIHGQIAQSCELGSDVAVELNVDSIYGFKNVLTLNNVYRADKGFENVICNGIRVEVVNNKLKKNHYSMTDSNSFPEINSISISIQHESDDKSPPVEMLNRGLKNILGFDLSNLNQIKFINYFSFRCLKKINIGDVDFIKKINPDKLLSLWIHCNYISINQELKMFKNLKYINTPYEYLNFDLVNFDSLSYLNVNKPIYYFSNYMVNCNVTKFPEYHEEVYDFPQSFFFVQNTYYKFKENLFALMYDYRIKEKLFFSDTNYSGPLYITGKDLDITKQSDGFDYSDSLMISGKIVNGIKVGEWKFKFQANQHFFYEINFDSINTNICFPLNGQWEYKYPNGKIALKGVFKNGKKNGVWYFYYPNGILASKKNYVDDLPKYNWFCYDESGKLILSEYYFNEYDYIFEKSIDNNKLYGHIMNFTYCGYNSRDSNTIDEWKNGSVVRTIKDESREYNKIINQYFLKYLYANK